VIPELGDLFRFFFVHPGKFCTRALVSRQEFVELGVDGQRIPLLRSLNQKRHAPYGKRRNRVPIERLGTEEIPTYGVDGHDHECRRVRGQRAKTGEKLSDALHPITTQLRTLLFRLSFERRDSTL
jgi:hypothetical protein